MSDTLDRKLLEKGLISLLCKTEIITYDIAWNDAIRHVLMDLKTGMYVLSPQDNTRQQEGWVAEAYARLGFLRDHMKPSEVATIQNFLGPLPSPPTKQDGGS